MSEQLIDLPSQVFGSLADKTRLNIIHRLTKRVMSVSEIAEPYDMSMAAVSKHLKILEEAGVISRERRGKQFIISLSSVGFTVIETWIEFYRSYWEQTFDKLDNYLTKIQEEK